MIPEKVPQLQLINGPSTQNAIQGCRWVNIFPLTEVNKQLNPFEFEIKPTENQEMIDLSTACMQIQVNVEKKTRSGKVLGAPMLLMQCLFREVNVFINDTLVETSNHMHAHKAYLKAALFTSRQFKNEKLVASGFDGDFSCVNEYGQKIPDTVDSLTLTGPLLLDVFDLRRFLAANVKIRIQFIPAPTSYVFWYDKLDTYSHSLSNPKLWICRVKPYPDVLEAIDRGLREKGEAIYPLNKFDMHTLLIPKDTVMSVRDLLIHGSLPKIILVGFITNDAFNGSKNSLVTYYKDLKPQTITLYKDGMVFPYSITDIDFGSTGYKRAFYDLCRALPKEIDHGLSPSVTDQGLSLVGFNLNEFTKYHQAVFEPRVQNLRLEIQFKSATTSNINAVILMVRDATLKIDKFGIASTSLN